MLYVFSVDIGEMYSFEMELAMESVQVLMSYIASSTGITADKQVLLVTGGETLDPGDRVCNYSNAGTDTSPIYLFSKSTIESSVPPSPSLTFGSESTLKDQVEVSFKLPPTYETLVSRAQLASEFNRYAVEIAKNCEKLVSEQSYQQLGWASVVANLDNIAKEFSERASTVKQSYGEFLESRPQYLELLQGYGEILDVLGKIPVLPSLLHSSQVSCPGNTDGNISLLDWINAQDNKNSLQDIVLQCRNALEQFDGTVLEEVMMEVVQVQEALNNSSMKEIKGLDERLLRLQELLQRIQELVQSQAEMAQGFIQNQTRAQNIGDPSVLPDLCASHQKQLMMLMKNHSQLRDYLCRCAKAKEELSSNLHTRLRWIMYVEKKICDSDSTLIIYHENIRRVRRRLDILDQVSEAPKLYILASAEVVRRHKFSSQFLKWASKLHESVREFHSEEVARREEFAHKFGRHFLQTLFTGLEDRPSKFADRLPKPFDTHLPIITEQDLNNLQSLVPEFKDCLENIPLFISMNELSPDNLLDVTTSQHKDLTSMSKTAMSVDVSTQVVWKTDGQDSTDEISATIKKNLTDASSGSSDSAQFFPTGESPPKEYHRDSDTGSEPSSGLTDSDIMFRSAQEDYVTVLKADFEAKDDEDGSKDAIVQAGPESHESSQTLTLTSSSSQSTQTDISLEEKLLCSEVLEDSSEKIDTSKDKESITQLENKIQELEDELAKTTANYTHVLQQKENLDSFRTNVKEYLQTLVVSMRRDLSQSKEFVSSCSSKMEHEFQTAINDVQKYVSELEVTFSESRTKVVQEYDHRINHMKENFELEKQEFLSQKSQLELERNNVMSELDNQIQEKNALKVEQQTLTNEKNRLIMQLQQTAGDRNSSAVEMQKLTEESSNLKLQLHKVIEEKNLITVELQKLNDEKDSISLELQKIAGEKNKVTLELQKVVEEKNAIEIKLQNAVEEMSSRDVQSMTELEKVQNILEEYKTKCEDQHATLTKQKEIRNKTEEEQQTRFNSIIQSLTKEKKQIVSQLNEKVKEMEIEIGKYKAKLEEHEKEREMEVNARERNELSIQEKESRLQTAEAKLQEAEKKWNEREAEFKKLLEKEKASALLLLEVEKQMWEASKLKTQDAESKGQEEQTQNTDNKTVGTEGNTQDTESKQQDADAMETSFSTQSDDSTSLNNEQKLLQLEQAVVSKDKQIENLKKQLLQQVTGGAVTGAEASKPDKVCLKDFQCGDLILLVYDPRYENYLIFSTGPVLYFLHPDSIGPLDLTASGTKRRDWVLACLTDKEYCQAKKAQNRFHVPAGTKFYRVQAKPWER